MLSKISLPLLLILFLFSVICFILITLSIRPPSVDPQLLHSNDCRFACWNGLVAGKTDLVTLREVLAKRLSNFEETNVSELANVDVRIFNIINEEGSQVHIDVVNNIISQIRVTAPAFSLSLDEIISQLGTPKYSILYYYIISTDRVNISDSQLAFFYPELGYVFSISSTSSVSDDGVETCVYGNQLVNDIRVVPPGTITQIFGYLDRPSGQDIVFLKDVWRNVLLNALKPFSGFGCFKMPYSPYSKSFMETW